tara:strand:- start:385 stop:600 length:216 start_codon:yes stop_codon:yes gene_type:complete
MQELLNKPAAREMAATIARNAGAAIALTIIGFGMAFTLLNMMLGCETWDQSLWTEYNSCVTPSMLFNEIFG